MALREHPKRYPLWKRSSGPQERAERIAHTQPRGSHHCSAVTQVVEVIFQQSTQKLHHFILRIVHVNVLPLRKYLESRRVLIRRTTETQILSRLLAVLVLYAVSYPHSHDHDE